MFSYIPDYHSKGSSPTLVATVYKDNKDRYYITEIDPVNLKATSTNIQKQFRRYLWLHYSIYTKMGKLILLQNFIFCCKYNILIKKLLYNKHIKFKEAKND